VTVSALRVGAPIDKQASSKLAHGLGRPWLRLWRGLWRVLGPAYRSHLARAICLAALSWGLLPAPLSAAVFEPREFASAQQEERYKRINAELRCLVCQNQNIASSDAPLAQDLRREVFRMLNEGSTDAQIIEYMVQRYGDFVFYRPPVNGLTIVLWAGPFVLFVIGLAFLWRVMGRRRTATATLEPLSAQQRERLRKLVAD
jgi:cytochrome c-type biogenesis protein CcmH